MLGEFSRKTRLSLPNNQEDPTENTNQDPEKRQAGNTTVGPAANPLKGDRVGLEEKKQKSVYQSQIACLMASASCTFLENDRSIVSGTMTEAKVPNEVEAIRVIQAVHRHPRYDSVMNPPMMGPSAGPAKVADENSATATARSTGFQMSAIAPPATAKGELPKTPIRKRQIMMVSIF
jgi:hypothetical protein